MRQFKRVRSSTAGWVFSPLGCLLLVGALTARADAGDKKTIYRYVNAEGRLVFVNDLAWVPTQYRPRCQAVDLSTVSTNRALGAELEKAVNAEIARLTASGYCVQLRQSAEAGWLSTLWRRHSRLIVIGGVMLLLLGISPWVTARIPGPQWGKILLVSLPALAMFALWTTAVVKTMRTTRLLREAAAPCQPKTYREVPNTPKAQRQRLGMIGKLKAQITEMRSGRRDRVDAALREGKGELPRRLDWIGPESP